MNDYDIASKCRRTARQIWREEPDLTLEQMLERHEIKLACEGKIFNRGQLGEWLVPLPLEEDDLPAYREQATWRLEEAIAIWNGIDPLVVSQSLHSKNAAFWNMQLVPAYRERFHLQYEKAKDSVRTGSLVALREGGGLYVFQRDFYEWASKNINEPLGHVAAEFFHELQEDWASYVVKTASPDTTSTRDPEEEEMESEVDELSAGNAFNNHSPCQPALAGKIIRSFRVQKDEDENERWWKNMMSDCNRYGLLECRVGEGKKGRGGGSYWRPDLIGGWLVDRHGKGKKGLPVKDVHFALKKFTGCDGVADDLFPIGKDEGEL